MKILITGVAGFIGSHLAEALASQGHDVVGMDNFNDYYALPLKQMNADDVQAKGVRIERLDLATDELAPALEGVEVVYHLAAQPGISATTPYEKYQRNNLVATYNLLEALRGSESLKMLINIATSSVYGAHATDSEATAPKPTSYYGVTKLAAEQMALAYSRENKLNACSLRLFSVYGPRERPEKLFPLLMHHMLAGSEFPLYEGSREHSRSFTYVGDIVKGFISVLSHLDVVRNEIFNIGSDIEITTGEAIDIVQEIMGIEAKFKIMPKRPGDQLRTHANIDKARQVLNYAPEVTPRQGFEKAAIWYKERVFDKIQVYG